MWVVLAILWTIVCERALVNMTTELPVSRFHLMSVRIVMGLAQAFLLTVVPWLVILFVSGSASETYPISQICFHVFLLWISGMVFIALAVLISSDILSACQDLHGSVKMNEQSQRRA